MASFRTALIALAMASTSMPGVSSAFAGPLSTAPVAAPQAATSAAPAKSGKGTALKIVAFGSSSTQGLGASGPAASYPSQLQAVLRKLMPQGAVAVLNRGIAGEDADDMMKRLKKDVIDRHPDIVIFQTGSNDPMRHVPLKRFERETRDSIVAMQKAGITVLLMEPQWCPTLDKIAAATAYRDVIRTIGADMKIDVIRRSDLMHDWIAKGVLTKRQMLASDGLHMRDQGYALLARWVATEITKTQAYKAAAGTGLTQAASL